MVIFLVGFMACGKTTIGKKIAKKLGFGFVDTDQFIEKKTNLTVSEIFSTKGESAFRELESEALRELASRHNVVVATGGGMPCYKDNMAFIVEKGISIYIQLSPLALLSRLKTNKTDRPLLNALTEDNLMHYIESSLIEREKFYNASAIKVEGIDLTVEKLMAALFKYVER
jgi:shikimate kinase